MSTVKVEFMLPLDVISKISEDLKLVSWEFKKAGVIELFRKGRISSGKAAEVLSMTKLNFLDLLSRDRIPYFNIPFEKLDEEYQTAQKSVAEKK